jgi:hypothetical protein
MRVFIRVQWSVLALCGLFGCGGTAQSQAHGSASYAAPPSQGGQPVSSASSSDDLALTVDLNGSGTFQTAGNAVCNLTSGDLTTTTTTTGQLDSDGSYQGSFDLNASAAAWSNPVCGAVQSVKLASVTSLTVEGSLPANNQTCTSYCSASAGVQCQGSSDSSCTGSATASCMTTCQAAQHITAQGALQQNDLATTNSDLQSSGQVNATVNLVFNAVD